QAYIDRINQYEPTYNAFTYINPDALQEAAALDAEYKLNGARSPLFGVPIVVKDSMNVAGMPTTSGFPGFVPPSVPGGTGMYLIPDTDSTIVARLREAGAIILGKTNLPQFARSANNANNSVFGPTYNTYGGLVNPIIPGASSSGTATATSGSFATLGTAEETGGSIENPAGAQSLVGVKTTFGLVPTNGGVPLSGSTRDVFGPIAKTVHDAAVTLDIIAGYSPSDPKTAASIGKTGGYAAGLSDTSLQGKRIGLWGPGFKNVTLTPETQALYDQDVAILQAQGAITVANPFQGSTFQSLTASSNFTTTNSLPYDMNQFFASLGPGMPHSYEEYKAMTGIDLFAANGPLLGTITPALAAEISDPSVMPDQSNFFLGRANLLAEFRRVMEVNHLDALFFPQESDRPGSLANGSYHNTTVSEINLLGTPGVDLPGGYYDGQIPFSVIFLGDTFSEGDLLSYAYDFEQATEFRVAPSLTTIPEPASLGVMSAAGTLLLMRRRRRAA
ncbi:MAG TPA: amidase, partial [Phycisphaerae bacterium]